MKRKISSIMIVFMLVATVFLSACNEISNFNLSDVSFKSSSDLETSQKLKKFNNADEIRGYILDNQVQNARSNVFNLGASTRSFDGDVMMEMAVSAPMAKGIATSDSGSSSAQEFSQTNVQVKDVDEADFIKNDGKYIYILSQDKLVIINAYPADDADIISETSIEGTPQQIFLNDDYVVVFSSLYDEVYKIDNYDFVPRKQYTQTTHAYVYDVKDKENPELLQDFSIDGDYFQARMIDNYVYFISKQYVNYYNNGIGLPVIRESGKMILSPDVYYFDNPENDFIFHTIASFKIGMDDIDAQSFLMGYSNNLYVSKENIYITYQKNLPYNYYRENNEQRFYEVVVPLLPSNIQMNINAIRVGSGSSYDKWDKIVAILEDMYNVMSVKDKDGLVREIEDAVTEYEAKKEIERSKTIIHKIGIKNGDIDYKAKGEVSGYLLNQFSMDEYENNLRVATTTQIWTRKANIVYNNVYVLDSGMDMIGKIEEIAPDESIYSTRFIGDRLYMVTFKRIDPLFVIDLSNPSDPKILGELKIPGYSDYLHPYDEDHIIGIGKETVDNEWGGTSVKGVKIALFDVSDVEKPKVIDQYEIGTSGTDSEALKEHKAFLFDKKKNLLVIPIREVTGYRTYDSRYGYYRQRVWQGAYVFGLTPKDGFELKGKISHYDNDEDVNYYWGSPYAVTRSLYMDEVLYTISSKKIVMNNLKDIDDEINDIELPYKVERPYPIYY